MASVEQLQLLRELVSKTISRLHILERENAVLKDRVQLYEGNLSSLSDENHALNKTQNLVQHEVSELLVQLEDLDTSLLARSDLASASTEWGWNPRKNPSHTSLLQDDVFEERDSQQEDSFHEKWLAAGQSTQESNGNGNSEEALPQDSSGSDIPHELQDGT